MIIRQAEQSDLEHIVRWRQEAAQWLSDLGSDQWSDVGLSDESFLARVQKSIRDGETWMANYGNRPVGTIAIDEWTDDGLWTPAEVSDAMFVHRMIIDRDFAGQGIGAALLNQAEQIAASKGKEWIRLDAWTSNMELHRYYESRNFQHVRTVEDHPSPSAALFARPVKLEEGGT